MDASVSGDGVVIDAVAGEFVIGVLITAHVVRKNKAIGSHSTNGRNTTSVEFNDGNSSTTIVGFGKTV